VSILKIPPLALVITFVGFIYISGLYLAPLAVPQIVSVAFSLCFIVTGSLFIVFGVGHFRINKTTVNPTKPEQATSLVTSGIYSLSRNPMYVGFVFWLAGFSFCYLNLISILLTLGFYIYMDKVQIPHEERALTFVFGERYTRYQVQVRRWL